MRSPLLRTASAALLGLLALVGCSRAPARPAGPNLLLITIDTLRADRLGLYGHGRPTSPGLDAFATTAVTFEDAGVHAPWTLPSFASMFTSTYSSTHGCWTFDSRLDDSFVTLAETLRDAGWDTALIASHVFLGARFGLGQGFVHVDDELVHEMYQSDRSITSPEVTQRAAHFIAQQAVSPDAGPWFLWAHYFDPHFEYQPQPGFSERFGLDSPADLYEGEIAFTDRHVAELLASLEAEGLADDTVVVVVSDHGEGFGDHGPLYHGNSLYQELLRTPLIIRAPNFAPRRVTEPVRAVDLMPTLLELLEVAPERPLAGRSLVPLMRGERLPEAPHLAELRLDEKHALDSLRRGRWKLILDRTAERRTLFDLESDPGETRDLASTEPARADALERELEELRAHARREAGRYSTGTGPELLPGQLGKLSDLGYVDVDAGDEP